MCAVQECDTCFLHTKNVTVAAGDEVKWRRITIEDEERGGSGLFRCGCSRGSSGGGDGIGRKTRNTSVKVTTRNSSAKSDDDEVDAH